MRSQRMRITSMHASDMATIRAYLLSIIRFAQMTENILPYVQGDVQMSVSALLVLGDKACGLIDDQIMEQWFASYVGELCPNQSMHCIRYNVHPAVCKLQKGGQKK